MADYAELAAKTDAATAQMEQLRAEIKVAEARMSEIAVLRTHIINYSKTRDVYIAYRKSGYSKKFRAAHEQELLLHKAAKQAFDELGLKKLPTVKSLQAEYGHLGESFRKGLYQVEDWKAWMDAHFDIFVSDLLSVKGEMDFPGEFQQYDSTRFHYVVVAGRRDDFSDTTYRTVRDKRQRLDIHLLHHDNLYDASVKLETDKTF